MEFPPKAYQQFSYPLTPYIADGPIGHTWREKGEKKLFLCVIFKVKLSVGPKKGQNSSYTHEVT